jgi:hypothetical protein
MLENVRLHCPIVEHEWHKISGKHMSKYVIIGGIYRQFLSRKLSLADTVAQVIRNEYFYIEALCCKSLSD